MDILKRNNVKVFGSGKQTMMFSHGFGCDQNMWRYITTRFMKDYKIVLFDHVGSGNSDLAAYDPDKYSTLKGYADDVVEICQELALEDVVLVGHSVGAMISILSAIQAPAYFSKLILIGPSPCYVNEQGYVGGFDRADIESMLDFMAVDYQDWTNTFSAFIMGNTDQPSLGLELAESFCRTDSTIAKQFARVTFLSDNRLDLPKLQQQCLILQCAEDMIAPAEVGTYMQSSLAQATLVSLQATGHCPNLSAPLETMAAMEAFLLCEN